MSENTDPIHGTSFQRKSRPWIYLPFLRELSCYSASKLRKDLIAASALTLVSIPQAIAFSLIMGLPPSAVIGSIAVGGFFSALLFSSHFHAFGPTTSICLITTATVAANPQLNLHPLQLAAYLAFLIGVTQFAAGIFNFGEAAKFISHSVVVGYTTGIAILLITNQLPNFVMVQHTAGESFPDTFRNLVASLSLQGFSFWAADIFMATWFILVLVKRFCPRWPEGLVTLMIAAGFAQLYAKVTTTPLPFQLVSDVGELTRVVPHLNRMPPWAEQMEVMHNLAGSAIAIAVIGMLEATAITKSLATKSGQRFSPNQEFMGMGVGNIAASFFGCIPGSSSFSRSAVNYHAGAVTQMAAFYSSLGVLLALFFVAPAFNYIPVAALSAYLTQIGYKLINWSQIRVTVRATRADAIVFFTTLLASLLLRLDTAIYVGIGVSLALFLQKTSMPTLVEYSFNEEGYLTELKSNGARQNEQISIIHVEGELFFGAADLFQDQVRQLAEDQNIRVFILRLKNARNLDASTVLALDALHDYLRETQRHLLISGCSHDVMKVLRGSGLLEHLGGENVFPSESNPTLATKRALQRAKKLLPGKGDLRVFYDRAHEETPSI